MGALILWSIIGAIVWFAWLDDSKLRYNFQYDEVSYDEKPRDCDFLTAPLGKKNCSYEKEVSIVQYSISVSGDPIISYDEGKTWHVNEGGPITGTGVWVSWAKHYD